MRFSCNKYRGHQYCQPKQCTTVLKGKSNPSKKNQQHLHQVWSALRCGFPTESASTSWRTMMLPQPTNRARCRGQVEIPTNFSTARWVRWILSPNGLVGSFTSMTLCMKFGGSLDSVHFCWFPVLKRWQIYACKYIKYGNVSEFRVFWKCSMHRFSERA